MLNVTDGFTSSGLPAYSADSFYIGDVRYLVTSKVSTNKFYLMLLNRDVPDEMIFTNPQSAHDACTAAQNDTVVIFPGVYDINATTYPETGITWSKANTHLIAAYPPTQYNGQVRIASQGTTGIANTMNITSKESRFIGFNVTNSHSDADAKAIVLGDMLTVASLNNYFAWVGMAGIHGASALSSATAASLQFYGAAGTTFYRCQIGDSISKKTAASGQIRFTAAANGIGNQANTFTKCQIHSWSNTSGSYLVLNDGANAMDRLTFFDDCVFFNFDNGGGKPAAVLHMPAGTPTGYHVSLHKCMQIGSTAWLSATSVAANVTISMTAAGATGGTDISPT